MVWSKLMAILTRFSSLADQTSTSPSSDYIETPWKTASENLWKIWGRYNGRIESYGHFDPLLTSGGPDLLVNE